MSRSSAISAGRTARRGPIGPSRRRVARAATHVALLASLTLAPAAPGWAATATDDVLPPAVSQAAAEQARLVLNDLVAVVGPPQTVPVADGEASAARASDVTARVLVENSGTVGLDGLRLVVELHPRATSRSELRVALDGVGPSSNGQVVLDTPLSTLAAGDVGQLAMSLSGRDISFIDARHDVAVRPLVLSLLRGSTVLDEVRTAVIGVSRPIDQPLETALVLPLDSQPVARNVGLERRSAALRPGERLDRLVEAAEAVPAGLVTLAPAAHTLEDLEAAAAEALPGMTDLWDRVRAASSTTSVLSSPYALADVAALVSRDATASLATEAVTEGRRRLASLLGSPVGAAHLALGPHTPTSVDLSPVDVLVVSWDDAAGPDLDLDPSTDLPPPLRSARAPSGRALQVLVADPWSERQLDGATGSHGWDVDAHRVVVESAITFGLQPGVGGRTFVVLPPLGWTAPGALPSELTTRLADAPWLRLAGPDRVVARAAASTAGWAPTPTSDPLLGPVLTQLASTDVRFNGYVSAIADDEDRPPVFSRHDDMLVATSAWPSGDRVARARAILEDIDRRMVNAIGSVLIPADNVITLASELGTIPVTVQHPTGVPLDVVVEVTPQGRLAFEEGSTQAMRLESPGTSTVGFQARALGRGTFPLAITIRTPEGGVVLARALVSVRATAVSRPALIGIGVVLLLLLLVGRRRRPRPVTLEVVR